MTNWNQFVSIAENDISSLQLADNRLHVTQLTPSSRLDCNTSAAAAAWVRHKFNKNLGEPIKGIGKRGCCKNRRARRCRKTLLVIDMRLAGNEVPQPAQRTGDVENGPFRMVRLFAEQGLGVALLGVVGI